ncbi:MULTISPECIES: oxygen-insensitive NADPH nitroreductase [Nosocomiicoccus]|uniref:NADPH-dependent oxidoreductase n=1 Tax=Nosocomiicoccus massiliensis TaxID=1232430 RepID=A0AAF1BTC5_9STAP|nr:MULTISPECIES: oxygen-insensitive NADPH nitroreductase [Nosocomiicoccus]OFO52139.1 NADPH-dependent oxidoreductase [Nosocomiicoccus sp. HMSC059G07]WOS96817.1 oxygen-insensitive NADPH nitroreductase [Nosocomiicoccus massiliensis]
MNETIQLLQNHRSIRDFKDQPLEREVIETLVKSAQQASTSSYVQAYSIIGVTDEDKKQAIMEISTQPYVKDNGHLFIFVADYNRHLELAKRKGYEIHFDTTESLLIGVVDAALAAQNLAVAAESLDLGICYLGSIRNNTKKMIEILELPEGTFPVIGMAVGYKNSEGSFKERLPQDTVYFENTYPEFEQIEASLNDYDESITEYYKTRDENKRQDNWSEQVVKKLSKMDQVRKDIKDVLNAQGFLKD